MDYAGIVTTFRRLALEAGAAIMKVYDGPDFDVNAKSDASPVTDADELRRRADPRRPRARPSRQFPVVTEEQVEAATAVGRAAFFLVDPLDGTKEFVQRRGDFTVNIALIENGVPTPRRRLRAGAGPALLHRRRRALAGGGRRARPRSRARSRRSRVAEPDPAALVVVASKSHRDQATDDYIARYASRDFRSAGSSLKFCLVAAGEADLYPRLGRTMEWDTAAGQAVLLGAGGRVVRFDDHAPLAYGKKGFENPFFIAHAPGVALARLSPTVPVLLVIPARYASTRYPGKPLVELGARRGEARSLIRRSWEAAIAVPGVDRVVVATDDERIADAAARLRRRGGDDALRPAATAPSAAPPCRRAFGRGYDVVVNLQGDAPLTPPWFVSALDRGDAGRPGRADGDAGAALRRRGARRLPRGSPPRPGRRHDRGLRPRRAARSTSPRR